MHVRPHCVCRSITASSPSRVEEGGSAGVGEELSEIKGLLAAFLQSPEKVRGLGGLNGGSGVGGSGSGTGAAATEGWE